MRRFLNLTLTAGLLCYLAIAEVDLAAQAKRPPAKAAGVKDPVPSTPDSIAKGQTLFKKYCRFCHGDDATGNGPQAPKDTHPPNLVDDTWDHGGSDAEIYASIKDGIGPKFDMKGFNSKMTPEEMWSVINYLRSIGPKGAPR
jgi:mono/diheme cytochrome c family protein